MNLEEFATTLKVVNAEITNLIGVRTAYFETWPTEERVDDINRYRGYFLPVRSAMQQNMLLAPARIVDKDTRTASFPNLIAAIKANPNLLPHADSDLLEILEQRVAKIAQTIEKLITIRNKTLAHKDREGDVPSVTKAELDQLIEELVAVSNDLSSASDRSVTSWKMIETMAERDSALLLNDARVGFQQRQAKYEKLLEDTKQYEAPSEHA